MRWSWKLGEPLGIGVYVHWTFALLLGWIALSYWMASQSLLVAAGGMLFVITVFGCVLLHEFGHALAARRYGIPTRDITLLPIGGVARLERMPEKPSQELVVAVAGPAVNVVIAAALFAGLALTGGLVPMPDTALLGGSFLMQLLAVNVLLVAFNMIPAFPMDGGRVLRAGLASFMDYSRATQFAANLGRVLAVGFGLYGLFGLETIQPILILIAVFIFVAAGAEARMAAVRGALRGVTVGQIMSRRFFALAPEQTVEDAARLLPSSAQRDFPVVSGERLIGMLWSESLEHAITHGLWQTPLAEIMEHDPMAISPHDSLEVVNARMQSEERYSAPVVERQRLVGLLSQENIAQWVELAPSYQDETVRDHLVEAEVVSTNGFTHGYTNGNGNGHGRATGSGSSLGWPDETHAGSGRSDANRIYMNGGASQALLRGYCDTLFGGKFQRRV